MTKYLLSWPPTRLHLSLFQITFEMKIGITKHLRKYGDITFFVSQIADTLCEKKWNMTRLSKIHPSNSPCAGLSLRYKISPRSIFDKNWCYIIPFSHRIMFDDVLRICYRKFESEFQQMQSHKYKERCKRCNRLDVSQLLHLCQPLIWRCWVAQNSFSHKFNFTQAREIALKNENSNKFKYWKQRFRKSCSEAWYIFMKISIKKLGQEKK